MNLQNHWLLAKELYELYGAHCRQAGRENPLVPRAFFYGNLRPDLVLSFLHHRHTVVEAAPRLEQLYKDIASRRLAPEEASVKLGEMCHYICDFFCYMHTDDRVYDRYFQHLLFERRLQKSYKRGRTDRQLPDYAAAVLCHGSFVRHTGGDFDAAQLLQYLGGKQAYFLALPPSEQKNLSYPMLVASVALWAMADQLENSVRVDASAVTAAASGGRLRRTGQHHDRLPLI